MKCCLILVSALFCAPSALAQAPGGGVELEFTSDFGTGEFGGDVPAKKQAEDFLKEQGWVEGENGLWAEGGFTAAVEVVSIPCTTDQNRFPLCRQVAAMRALNNARATLAKALARQVSSRTKDLAVADSEGLKNLLEGGDGGPLDSQIAAELRKQISDRGLDPDSPEALAFAKNATLWDTFDRANESIAYAEVAALQAYRFFESIENGQGQIAAVVTSSPNSEKLVRALLGQGDPPKQAPQQNISEWAKDLGPDVLLYTHGCQMRFNERGELTLIGFGQAFPVNDSPRAMDMAYVAAEELAVGNIRDFLGTAVLLNTKVNTSMSLMQLAEASDDISGGQRTAQLASAEGKRLTIPGIAEVYQWSTTHPADAGDQIAGSVVTVNVTDMIKANDLRRRLAAMGGSRGGAGGSNRYSPDAAAGSNQGGDASSGDQSPTRRPRGRGSSSGQGAGGQTP